MYMIMTKKASMPASCWGASKYVRVALVELHDGCTDEPAMISTRAKHLKRIVQVYESVYAGVNYPHGRCAASRAYQQLSQRLDAISSEH